jgi:hypothetical protein
MTASICPTLLTWLARSRVCVKSERSAIDAMAPRSRRSCTAVSRAWERTWTTTWYPSASSVLAAACPSPSAEPVMKIRAFWLVFEGHGAEVCSFRGLNGACAMDVAVATRDPRLPRSLLLFLLQEIFDRPWTSRAFRANFDLVCRVDHTSGMFPSACL